MDVVYTAYLVLKVSMYFQFLSVSVYHEHNDTWYERQTQTNVTTTIVF